MNFAPFPQVSILMSAMTTLEICYPLLNVGPDPVFVFPSLLPALDLAELNAEWHNGTERTIFGRRYVLQEARGFPPTLLLHLFRRLHTIADRVDLVRRNHFFLALFGVNIMVRFNSVSVGIRSSSGQRAVALDIAASASAADWELGCCALDRTTLELALMLSSEEQFRSVRLTKYGFASHRPVDDPLACPPEADAVLGHLVWADPLKTSARLYLHERKTKMDWADALKVLQAERAGWLNTLPDAATRLAALVTTEHLLVLFNGTFLRILTDPYWVTEQLPSNFAAGRLNPARRFGHLPLAGETPSPTISVPQSPTTRLFEDHSVTVSRDLWAGGCFGSCYHQGRELGGFGRAVVIRNVRGATRNAHVAAAKFTSVSEILFNYVVRLVLPCKVAPDPDGLLLPLDADAFELTLADFLAEESTDELACLCVLSDVASGLHELHSNHLIHGRLTIERSVVVSRVTGLPHRRFVAKVRKL